MIKENNNQFYNKTGFCTYVEFYDIDGKPLFTGDEVNICFTSYNGEHVHDGIYTVARGYLGDLQFEFKELLWIDHGWNQYSIHSQLCIENRILRTVWPEGSDSPVLCFQDQSDKYKKDIEERNRYPFNKEKELAFHSRYIKKIL